MKRLRVFLSIVLTAGCSSSRPVDVKQKEEALHRGLTEAAKKADPAKNLKEASDAIRTFKISDAVDAGLKNHHAKTLQRKEAPGKAADKPENQSRPSQPTHSERRAP